MSPLDRRGASAGIAAVLPGLRSLCTSLLVAGPLLLAHADSAAGQAVRGERNGDGVLFGHSNVLGGNDDGSSGTIDIGFALNLYGTTYSQLFVNNNGNLTFDSSLSTFTPFNLTSTQRVIVAPFFADVDTRINQLDTSTQPVTARGVVSWGSYDATSDFGSIWGRSVFSATWNDVGYYPASTDRTNTFQVNLIERFDTGDGNFDIEFNYDQVEWETGSASGGSGGLGGNSARVGFSAGTGEPGTSYELAGSAVNGAFLDGGPNALVSGSQGTSVAGRYLFEVRNSGVAIPGETQQVPFLPSQTIPGDPEAGVPPTYIFNNAVSGAWYDPPDTEGYDYRITGGSLFTRVGLPTGINAAGDPFSIFYGDGFSSFFGSFLGGEFADFTSFAGGGLGAFRIRGIDPLVDSTNPDAFPVLLEFTQATGNSFEMTPVLAATSTTTPEPVSLALLGTGLAGLALARRKRRRDVAADAA